MTHRKYPDRPLVGVGAVVFRNAEVLLVQRGREPAYGLWSLPGGLVKVGESLEAAVCREVLEETGVVVKALDVVACLDRVIPDDEGRIAYHYVLVDFLCEPTHGEPRPGGDVLACAYFALERLSDLNLTRGAAEVIHKAHTGSYPRKPAIYDPSL